MQLKYECVAVALLLVAILPLWVSKWRAKYVTWACAILAIGTVGLWIGSWNRRHTLNFTIHKEVTASEYSFTGMALTSQHGGIDMGLGKVITDDRDLMARFREKPDIAFSSRDNLNPISHLDRWSWELKRFGFECVIGGQQRKP